MQITFSHKATLPLRYASDPELIAFQPPHTLYVQEVYYDAAGDAFLAEHCVRAGQISATYDEAYGRQPFTPLPRPVGLEYPAALPPAIAPLRYGGGRQRGLREVERLSEWVLPLSLPEKLALLPWVNRQIGAPTSAMQVFGVAESYLLRAVPLTDAQYLVCRRVRVAVALAAPRTAADGLPYDYDTLVLHVAHLYDAAAERAPTLDTALPGLAGVAFQRPLDCGLLGDDLVVADGGSGDQVSRLHFFGR